MPPAISIMDAPEIAPVTLPAKGMRIGPRRQSLDGTLHERQTRFHSISIDYAVSLNNCMPACAPGRCAMRLAQASRWGRSANRSISARRST